VVGLREAIGFAGDLYVLFGLSTVVFFYGGWPFLKGLYGELASRQPVMMTLVAVAITTAYLYSCAAVLMSASTVIVAINARLLSLKN
jgi:Cu2+-exporting ATPase